MPRNLSLAVLAVTAAAALAGCSSAPTGAEPNGRNAVENRINSFIAGPAATVAPGAGRVLTERCPYTEVRDGTAVHRIGGTDPNELRYQATITETARECTVTASGLSIKVGIEGRVVVGPKGGAGRVTLPLRIAVTRDLQNPVWTKLYHVTIDVPAGAPSVAFTQIEEAIPLNIPDTESDAYRIFIGFDPNAPAAPSGRRRR